MPALKERRQLQAVNRVRVGGVSASDSYTQIAGRTDGWMSFSGCARQYKDLLIRPQDFDVRFANASGVGASGVLAACSGGSLFSSCVTFDFTGSAFNARFAASNVGIPALSMGAGASPASPLTAIAYIPKPTDADTTGSIIAYVDWTSGLTPATTGSTNRFLVGLGYLNGLAVAPCPVRTAASVGGNANASYAGTACGVIQSTCVGKLPSFGVCDLGATVVLQIGASAGAETGKIDTGCLFILGLRLRYVACALGFQVNE